MSSKDRLKQKEDKSGVSVRISWAQLGWHPVRGSFEASDGPLRVLVVAPWCPDCVETLPDLARTLDRGRSVVAGEFAPATEFMDFCEKSGVSSTIPLLGGTFFKSEQARNEARFRQLRAAFGDTRKWGVPSLFEGRLENGVFVVGKFTDLSA